MRIAQDEIFGPVAPLFCFDTEAKAVVRANNTPFGLVACLYTENLSRSTCVAEELDVGMVAVNTASVSTEVAPFGGVKQSGPGRKGSRQGLGRFLAMKAIHIGL